MHELIRTKDKYIIIPASGINSPDMPRIIPWEWPLKPGNEPDKKVWQQFVTNHNQEQLQIKASISESWKRCLQLGVDPSQRRCNHFRGDQPLDSEQRFLRDVVRGATSEVTDYLEEKGLLFTICDRYGYLTGTIGSYPALQLADALDFGPGADWTEQSVGSNAIGMALANGLPQQVVGREHFCEGHQGWTCSAAPIFGINGMLHGCVDFSGPMQADHSQCLFMAIYYARAIEALLFQKQCFGMLGHMLNSSTIGLLTLDRLGKVCYCNRAAATLFGSSVNRIVGKDASKWFDLAPLFCRCRETDDQSLELLSMVELRCLYNPTWNVFATPLRDKMNLLNSLPVCIYPPVSISRPPKPAMCPQDDGFAKIIGKSEQFQQVIEKARRVAPTDATVLITGQSGTGKEVMARALHKASPRAKQPFVAINCGAIPPDLIQTELFGYAEGAFTGARRGGQPGKFEQASGGTLFLDEIGEMPLAVQVNLLRVLDEKKICRIGDKRTIPIDIRFIAATNRNLDTMVTTGDFRRDLYYRLHVVVLTLPPLCDRGGDVQLLADHFIQEFSSSLGRRISKVTPDFREALAAYSWPGNIRELRHVIESTIIFLEGETLNAAALPEDVLGEAQQQSGGEKAKQRFSTLNFEELQKQVLRQALTQYQGNISKVAAALGIGRNTTYAKLKKYHLL